MKILMIHPDMGIGGAERLVVEAAVALKALSHDVHIITAHHDPNHCFRETRDGTLSVTVYGDSLPRSVFGKCQALCSYFRMMIIAIYVVFFSTLDYDLIFCDSVSSPIPVLKLSKKKVIFYCHFPDQLLTKRDNWIKRVYRAPLDWFEQYSTGLADAILVNSKFTANVFRETFKRLSKVPIQVLYPSINFSAYDRPLEGDVSHLRLKGVDTVFLSINRYERKKHLNLAIESLAHLCKDLQTKSAQNKKSIHLVMVGGYDKLVVENREHFEELEQLAIKLGVNDKVTFIKSPTDAQKHLLIHSSTAVIYTPENEHFGIVPLEAMYMRRPVIACNSGGPLESIKHEETGFLCDPNPESFAEAMKRFVYDRSLAREMGILGHERVIKNFSFEHFKDQLNNIITNLNTK